MVVCVQEKMLHEAWRRADGDRAGLDVDGGARYRVLYSGMPGGSIGPDFRDAVLEASDGSEVQGDVEIHRTAAEWYAHGHDRDGRYGGVVFHAVAGGITEGRKTVNGIGIAVPEVDIGALVDEGGEPVLGHVPDGSRRGGTARGSVDGEMDEWLDAAGDERFALKVESQRVAVEIFGPDLALQMAIFECLGYPRNRAGFRHLATRLPWAFLARYARFGRSVDDVGAIRAERLMRWGAGFDERPDWVDVPRLLGEEPSWVAAAGRPANRVETRLKAAARIVSRWWEVGGPLRQALAAMIAMAPITKRGSAASVRDEFVVDRGLVGRGRAGEIVVNAVLPTLAAWAETGQDSEMYSAVLRTYRIHPALPSNSVFEEAKRVLARRGVELGKVRGARRQQGVMHIYKSMLLRPKVPRQMRLGGKALSA